MNPLGALGGAVAGPSASSAPAPDPSAPGFAGLFALLGGFGQTGAQAQSEPTALPLQALTAPEADPADEPLTLDALGAGQPDPALLAALGLPPLPVQPALAQAAAEGGADAPKADAPGLLWRTPAAAAHDALAAGALTCALSASAEGGKPGPGPFPQATASAVSTDSRIASPAHAGAIAAAPLPTVPEVVARLAPGMPATGELPAEPASGTAAAPQAPQAPRAAADFSAAELAPAPRMAATAATSPTPVAVAAFPIPSGNRDSLPQRTQAGVEATGSVGFERPEGLFREAGAQHTVQAAQAALQPRLDAGSGQFGAQLGQQMLWMGQQKIGRAEIRLDPAELGPLTIELEMDGDEIRAEFSSRSAEVRALIDSQVPRLRELLAEQGFSLSDAQVGQGRADERGGQSSARADARATGEAGAEQDASTLAAAPVRARQGLVDDYA